MQSPAHMIRDKIDFDCPICCMSYDDILRYPMQVCRNQHSCCHDCFDGTVFAKGEHAECFMCKVPVKKSEATRFRLLDEIREATMRIQVQGHDQQSGEGLMKKSKEELVDLVQREKQKNEWLMSQMIQKDSSVRQPKQVFMESHA